MLLEIKPGATADVVTPAELHAELVKASAVWMERGKGIKWTESWVPAVSQPGQPGATTYQDGGPNAGFSWKLRIVVAVLAAAGTIAIFKGESIAGRPIGTAQSVSAAGLNIAGIFFPDDIMIRGQQQIFMSAGATVINSYYRGAVQVPAEREGEILS